MERNKEIEQLEIRLKELKKQELETRKENGIDLINIYQLPFKLSFAGDVYSKNGILSFSFNTLGTNNVYLNEFLRRVNGEIAKNEKLYFDYPPYKYDGDKTIFESDNIIKFINILGFDSFKNRYGTENAKKIQSSLANYITLQLNKEYYLSKIDIKTEEYNKFYDIKEAEGIQNALKYLETMQ